MYRGSVRKNTPREGSEPTSPIPSIGDERGDIGKSMTDGEAKEQGCEVQAASEGTLSLGPLDKTEVTSKLRKNFKVGRRKERTRRKVGRGVFKKERWRILEQCAPFSLFSYFTKKNATTKGFKKRKKKKRGG